MAKKPSSALAGIFDDEGIEPVRETVAAPTSTQEQARPATSARSRRAVAVPASQRGSSHPGKKPVLIHIPEDMHRTLRQLSVEEGGEPLTVVTERLLRQYLVQRGHARFAP